MAVKRMAGSQEFQQKMSTAVQGQMGGQGKGKPAEAQGSQQRPAPTLIGADAWDRQVSRESEQFNNAAVSGSRNADNIAAYARASRSATASNGDFSIDAGNKWANNSREQSKTNKEDNAGFSDTRVSNNVDYANRQQDRNMQKSEGFAMTTTNNFINNSKNHREDNTAKATPFEDQTVDKYLAKNKGNQSTNIQALDSTIRKAPIYDRAYSQVQGLKTYGDMYRYGRESLPNWSMPNPMEGVKDPDIGGMTNDYMDRIDQKGDDFMKKLK